MFLKYFSLIFKYFHQSSFFFRLRKTAHKISISKKLLLKALKLLWKETLQLLLVRADDSTIPSDL